MITCTASGAPDARAIKASPPRSSTRRTAA
eukprot:ctg_6397.g526